MTVTKEQISEVMRELGKRGGRKTSPRKTRAARKNAKKGGWPKGKKRGPTRKQDANRADF